MSNEELVEKYKKQGYLTWEKLKNFVNNNPDINDNSLILTQRRGGGYTWDLIKKDTKDYEYALSWNSDIEQGKVTGVMYSEEELEYFKDSYSPICSAIKYKDDNIYLDIHY